MENPQENKPQSLHDLKESIIEEEANEINLDVSFGVENDEINNEEMQKGDALANLEYADGKQRDEVDLAEEQEKIYGVDVISPFKTGDIRVFRRKLETMSRDKMSTLANRVAARTYSSEADQKEELIKAFYSWASTNSFIQTAATKKSEKGALSEAFEDSESVNSLEEKLKSKTLSDLQSTAARLGFNPSFDRERLIKVITQEYQRQS
tara:strand:+ start:182 stop:805 length:624 start_codon:yes stop_codon:yes gene_type:complete